MSVTCDIAFSDALRRAGAKMPDAIGVVVAMLRDPKFDVRMGEREMLARLLLRELEPNTGGRPLGQPVPAAEKISIVLEYRAFKFEKGRAWEKRIAHEIAKKYGISVTTLRSWNTDIRRDEKFMEAQGLPHWRLEHWNKERHGTGPYIPPRAEDFPEK